MVAQGVEQVRIEARAHLRYDGSHQALEVPFGPEAEMRVAFEEAHKQRFGFVSPERGLLFEMISVEAIGETGEAPSAVVSRGRWRGQRP